MKKTDAQADTVTTKKTTTKTEKKSPLFEVLRDKEGLMCTDSFDAIYDEETLEDMQKSGHTFKYNGKAISLAQLKKVLQENKKKK
jgi:hypothetical protein